MPDVVMFDVMMSISFTRGTANLAFCSCLRESLPLM